MSEHRRKREDEVVPGDAAKQGVGLMAAWFSLGLAVILLVVTAGFSWYTRTADFQRRVKSEFVRVLEDATGGRVDLGAITFHLWHLTVVADRLVIHGLEGPGEAPYLSAERVEVRVKIFNFFAHTAGSGLGSHVALNYLRVDRPLIHLIVNADGTTNQPIPKRPRTSTVPVTDTLLDLRAETVEMADGVVLVNEKSTPFELAARGLSADVHYLHGMDRYRIQVDLKDLRTKLAGGPEAKSELRAMAELGRDVVELHQFDFRSGKASELTAVGSLVHFAKPEWKIRAEGSVELTQVSLLSGVEGLNAGSVELEVDGHNCVAKPAEAPKQGGFWRRGVGGKDKKHGPNAASADPECLAGYLFSGTAKVRGAAYRNIYVQLHDVNGGARLHVTPDELLLTEMTGAVVSGGSAEGTLRIVNWLGNAPQSTGVHPSKSTAAQGSWTRAYLDATVTKLPLRTIMDVTAEHYGDLGFDTAVSGPVKVQWGGPEKDVADTVEADGELRLTPTGVKRKGALSDVPVTGRAVAHYVGKTEVVQIQSMALQTPQANMEASGLLGVNLGDRLTDLRVDLTVRDLDEFNQLLTTLDLEGFGKKGRAAIPLVLHGPLQFNGTARGVIANLDVKGHLQGSAVEAQLSPTASVLMDTVDADGEYSPNGGVALAASTIRHGTTLVHVMGDTRPHKLVSGRGVATYVWDELTSVDAKVQIAAAPVQDVLQIAGQAGVAPVTGTMDADGQLRGTFASMLGDGRVTLRKGVAYGEPFDTAAASLTVQGKDVEASQIVVQLAGVTVKGNGGFNIGTKRLHGHAEMSNLLLSKLHAVQQSKSNVDGVLSVVADANGTLSEPGMKAYATLKNLTLNDQAAGEIAANVHSEGKVVNFVANANVVGATAQISGETELVADYPTQAKLTFSGLDVNRPLAIYAPGRVVVESSIGGVVTVSGPLRVPKELTGQAVVENVDVKLQGIELKTVEPMRMGLQGGIVRLEALHILGQDTDMTVSGTGQIFGASDVKGGKLDVKAKGSVSTALLHTFDPDIVSSGKVEFTVAAGGQVLNPTVTGRVKFDKVNASIDGVPNGLSDMNGTLVFNQDRLQVESLTAMTGGGQLNIGGSLRYRNGVYADLTATGDAVRVRLYGISATANAHLKLQGGIQGALLSGNVVITRFGVGQNVDFAAFAGGAGVSAPSDLNAPTNKIRLDVRVTSAPQLDFQNSYAKLAGTVDLTLRGTVAEPTVLGRIQITDGSATFAGTKYQLQRGDVYFTNPVRIDPVIDLDATARVENYDITIGLHGTATSLKPTYRSEPPLSEADVFALLALGRTQEEAQLYQEQQMQGGADPTTSSLLGGALNATVSNRVEKLFGVGSVKIDPAFVGTLGNSAARITVQQQISRQLTATYATNVNQSAQQLIQLQYDLNRNMSIVATRDETGVFSIVYKLRRRYR